MIELLKSLRNHFDSKDNYRPGNPGIVTPSFSFLVKETTDAKEYYKFAASLSLALISYFLMVSLDGVATMALFVLMAISGAYALYLIPTIFVYLLVIVGYKTLFRQYRGHSSPGIVVAIHPLQIAVLSDISKVEEESFQVLKIITPDSDPGNIVSFSLEDVVAIISRYSGRENNKWHWDDFHPIPAYLITKNKSQVSALYETYTAEDISQIKQIVKHLEKPYLSGRYHYKNMDGETTLLAMT